MPSHADALFLLSVYCFCKRELYIAGYNTQYFAEAYLISCFLLKQSKLSVKLNHKHPMEKDGKCMNAVITYLLYSNFTIVIRA